MYKYRYETEDMMKTSETQVPVHGYHVVEGGYYPAESGLVGAAVAPVGVGVGLNTGSVPFPPGYGCRCPQGEFDFAGAIGGISPIGLGGVGGIGGVGGLGGIGLHGGLGAGGLGLQGGIGQIGVGGLGYGHIGPQLIGGGGVGTGIGAVGLGGGGGYVAPIVHGYGRQQKFTLDI